MTLSEHLHQKRKCQINTSKTNTKLFLLNFSKMGVAKYY